MIPVSFFKSVFVGSDRKLFSKVAEINLVPLFLKLFYRLFIGFVLRSF